MDRAGLRCKAAPARGTFRSDKLDELGRHRHQEAEERAPAVAKQRPDTFEVEMDNVDNVDAKKEGAPRQVRKRVFVKSPTKAKSPLAKRKSRTKPRSPSPSPAPKQSACRKLVAPSSDSSSDDDTMMLGITSKEKPVTHRAAIIANRKARPRASDANEGELHVRMAAQDALPRKKAVERNTVDKEDGAHGGVRVKSEEEWVDEEEEEGEEGAQGKVTVADDPYGDEEEEDVDSIAEGSDNEVSKGQSSCAQASGAGKGIGKTAKAGKSAMAAKDTKKAVLAFAAKRLALNTKKSVSTGPATKVSVSGVVEIIDSSDLEDGDTNLSHGQAAGSTIAVRMTEGAIARNAFARNTVDDAASDNDSDEAGGGADDVDDLADRMSGMPSPSPEACRLAKLNNGSQQAYLALGGYDPISNLGDSV